MYTIYLVDVNSFDILLILYVDLIMEIIKNIGLGMIDQIFKRQLKDLEIVCVKRAGMYLEAGDNESALIVGEVWERKKGEIESRRQDWRKRLE